MFSKLKDFNLSNLVLYFGFGFSKEEIKNFLKAFFKLVAYLIEKSIIIKGETNYFLVCSTEILLKVFHYFKPDAKSTKIKVFSISFMDHLCFRVLGRLEPIWLTRR
jgi:hypothetical protein